MICSNKGERCCCLDSVKCPLVCLLCDVLGVAWLYCPQDGGC